MDRESKPMYFNLYKQLGAGAVYIAKDINKQTNDYNPILTIARQFAEMGHKAYIAMRCHYKSPEYRDVFGALIGTRYERKCPDLIIDGLFYEFEGYVRPWNKRKLANMLSHGLVQSSRIIIDNSKGTSDRQIRKAIIARQADRKIKEVWLYEKGRVRLFFKNGMFCKNNGEL